MNRNLCELLFLSMTCFMPVVSYHHTNTVSRTIAVAQPRITNVAGTGNTSLPQDPMLRLVAGPLLDDPTISYISNFEMLGSPSDVDIIPSVTYNVIGVTPSPPYPSSRKVKAWKRALYTRHRLKYYTVEITTVVATTTEQETITATYKPTPTFSWEDDDTNSGPEEIDDPNTDSHRHAQKVARVGGSLGALLAVVVLGAGCFFGYRFWSQHWKKRRNPKPVEGYPQYVPRDVTYKHWVNGKYQNISRPISSSRPVNFDAYLHPSSPTLYSPAQNVDGNQPGIPKPPPHAQNNNHRQTQQFEINKRPNLYNEFARMAQVPGENIELQLLPEDQYRRSSPRRQQQPRQQQQYQQYRQYQHVQPQQHHIQQHIHNPPSSRPYQIAGLQRQSQQENMTVRPLQIPRATYNNSNLRRHAPPGRYDFLRGSYLADIEEQSIPDDEGNATDFGTEYDGGSLYQAP